PIICTKRPVDQETELAASKSFSSSSVGRVALTAGLKKVAAAVIHGGQRKANLLPSPRRRTGYSSVIDIQGKVVLVSASYEEGCDGRAGNKADARQHPRGNGK
ncbi:MAG: hypothetical protein M3R24_09000, partial [Chloroflexota bacterium]|nr:hypothetical protein [Chloroflexota bacterium]